MRNLTQLALSSVLRLLASVRPFVAIVRALALTYVIAISLLCAVPSRPYDHERLRRPQQRQMVRSIQRVLAAVGVETPRSAIRETLVAATSRMSVLRKGLLAPLQPALDFVGSRQRWGLFLQGDTIAYRLQVEGRAACEPNAAPWVLLYRAQQFDALELAGTLEYRRLRGIYNPGRNASARAQYDTFADWLAREVMRKRPEYQAVRVTMQRLRLGTREQPSQVERIELERIRSGTGAS